MIIDMHTHIFPRHIAEKTAEKLGTAAHIRPHTDGTLYGLLVSMRHHGIAYSVTQPAVTNPDSVEHLNNTIIERLPSMQDQGILPFGGMHPDYPHVRRELLRLKNAGVRGIKLHPAYQRADLDDPRNLQILYEASDLGMIVLTHAGVDISVNGYDYASVEHVLHVLKEVQPQKLVLAHMGGWGNWAQVESDLAGAPVWLDTAFTYGRLDPYPGMEPSPHKNTVLSPEAFVRLCRRHGIHKILFGTDSPWQDQGEYVARLQAIGLTAAEQEAVLGKNAAKLLELPGTTPLPAPTLPIPL